MSFLHGWALALGMIGIAAPLAVHLLTKPRPQIRPLSTIRFLQEVIQQRRARSRLRDFIVLALRTLAVALLAATLARPLLSTSTLVAARPAAPVQRVVLLDVSQSMSAGAGGTTAFSRAQAAALRYLDMPVGAVANVVLVGATPQSTFQQCSPNLVALRETVKQSTVVAQRADVRLAMQEAGRLLSQDQSAPGELVVVSDFQRANWGNLHLDLIPESTQVQLERVAEDDTANVAITEVRWQMQPIVGRDAVLEVEVSNSGDRPADVRCQVQIGPWQQTLTGRVEGLNRTVLSAPVQFAEPGWFSGWARLVNNLDVLPADDERPVAVQVVRPPRMLLLSRQATQQKPSSSFYLERALQVLTESESPHAKTDPITADPPDAAADNSSTVDGMTNRATLRRIQPQRTPAASWPECDVLVLDHPGALDEKAIELIAARVRRGAGLLYFTGELVDGVNLEKLKLAFGASLQPPIDLVTPAAGTTRSNLYLTSVVTKDSPLEVLGDRALSALRPVRFGGGLATRATEEGLQDQVLGELSDSSAWGYLTSCDAGQVAVINADLEDSNWCTQPTFVPVLGHVLNQLATGRVPSTWSACGEPMVQLLAAGLPNDARFQVQPADDRSPVADEYGTWEWSDSLGGWAWVWNRPVGAGVYRAEHQQVPVAMVATSAPAVESDLQSLEAEVMRNRLAGTRAVGVSEANQAEDPEDWIWSWMIVGCVLGLSAEILALGWFRS
ncbi:MAG: BatA and WFA domain-containing protein [Pirellulales bacterium]